MKWTLTRRHMQMLIWIGGVLVVLSEVARLFISQALSEWLFWLGLGWSGSLLLALRYTRPNRPL